MQICIKRQRSFGQIYRSKNILDIRFVRVFFQITLQKKVYAKTTFNKKKSELIYEYYLKYVLQPLHYKELWIQNIGISKGILYYIFYIFL